MLKTGVCSTDLGFSPHFRNHLSEVCDKFWNPQEQWLFRIKEPQVEALPIFDVVGIPGICRILLD